LLGYNDRPDPLGIDSKQANDITDINNLFFYAPGICNSGLHEAQSGPAADLDSGSNSEMIQWLLENREIFLYIFQGTMFLLVLHILFQHGKKKG
jgi:hypothetical protein